VEEISDRAVAEEVETTICRQFEMEAAKEVVVFEIVVFANNRLDDDAEDILAGRGSVELHIFI